MAAATSGLEEGSTTYNGSLNVAVTSVVEPILVALSPLGNIQNRVDVMNLDAVHLDRSGESFGTTARSRSFTAFARYPVEVWNPTIRAFGYRGLPHNGAR